MGQPKASRDARGCRSEHLVIITVWHNHMAAIEALGSMAIAAIGAKKVQRASQEHSSFVKQPRFRTPAMSKPSIQAQIYRADRVNEVYIESRRKHGKRVDSAEIKVESISP